MPIPKFRKYQKILKILNTFGDLTSIPKSEGARGCGWGYQMCWKFSGIERIRVFTWMHQMYSKFSKFSGIRKSVPLLRILRHLSTLHVCSSKTIKKRFLLSHTRTLPSFVSTKEKKWIKRKTLFAIELEFRNWAKEKKLIILIQKQL